MEKFDVVVIGAGPGGYPAAIRAAQLGASVAIVERELPGGTCLNWGCIPTKTLIAAAELYAHIQHAAEFGIAVGAAATCDYAAMIRRKNAVTEKLRHGVAALLKANGVKWFQGTAAFLGRNRISVRGEGTDALLDAGCTILATGSTSAMPGFLPKHPRVTESRSFLDRTALPSSLIVLGGGVIGCEFACMAARLGVKVTVVEMLEDILIVLDPDVRRELRRAMESAGIRILTGKPLTAIAADDNGVRGQFGDEALQAELLLVSIGRKPVTAELDLGKAAVTVTKTGHIEVDPYGQTSAASIYAIGDVNGGPQLAHAATAQGITAAENACRKSRRAFEPLVPACIFTAPEVGSVGLTEAQAQEKKIAVKTGKFPFTALGKAMATGDTTGFVKWVADAATDRLLGAQAVGPHATELIAEACLAIRAEYTAAELSRVIHCHPTLAESWMEAAHALHGECLHTAPKRKA